MNRPSDWIIGMFCRLCTGATAAATLLLVGFLIVRGIGTLHTRLFFGETPWVQAVTGRQPIFEGIWPALCGTALLVFLSAPFPFPSERQAASTCPNMHLDAPDPCWDLRWMSSPGPLLS